MKQEKRDFIKDAGAILLVVLLFILSSLFVQQNSGWERESIVSKKEGSCLQKKVAVVPKKSGYCRKKKWLL